MFKFWIRNRFQKDTIVYQPINQAHFLELVNTVVFLKFLPEAALGGHGEWPGDLQADQGGHRGQEDTAQVQEPGPRQGTIIIIIGAVDSDPGGKN